MIKQETKSYPIWHPNTQKRFAEAPIKVEAGEGPYLILENGKKILDMTCSWWVNLHGHSHPAIANAIHKQALRLEQVLFANFTHDPAIQLSEGLLQHLPDHLSKVFFSDNGSTSVEVAMKIAHQYWINKGHEERKRFISFENAYHGDTIGAMSVSAPSVFSQKFTSLLFDVDRIPFPATFEGDNEVEKREAQSLKALQILFQVNKGQYSALLVEPLIQGASGMRMCRPEFLRALEKLAREAGLIIIYDEVFVGFGRAGDWFACVKSGTKPDIVCLSKGITGGFLPLAATVTTEELYEAFYQDDPMKSFFHGHSYTANPLGCAAGIASLRLLEENPGAFLNMESLHRKHSENLRKHEKVTRLRYCGAVAAFNIMTQQEKGYLNHVGNDLRKLCLERGIYIRPLGDTVYVMPPYCCTEEQIAEVYYVLSKTLREVC